MNVIILTDLEITKFRENEEAVIFRNSAGGPMASFSAKEMDGNGYTNWAFQAFDNVVDFVKKLQLKKGDHVNIRGHISIKQDPQTKRFTTFCKVREIELVKRATNTSSQKNIEGSIPQPKVNAVENREKQIEQYISQGSVNLNECDPFSQSY